MLEVALDVVLGPTQAEDLHQLTTVADEVSVQLGKNVNDQLAVDLGGERLEEQRKVGVLVVKLLDKCQTLLKADLTLMANEAIESILVITWFSNYLDGHISILI